MSNLFDGISLPESTEPVASDDWKDICTELDGDRVAATTKRLPVPSGGWIYRTILYGKDGPSFMALTFVPDVEFTAELKEMQALTAEMMRRLAKE
jgi:hypothetical protein